FVYGTLMKGESNSNYLHKPVNRKRAILSGYKMYQVSPSFPGIVKSNIKNTYIYGECMYVTLKDVLKLDCLESNGYLYKREFVKVTIDNKECDAIVYVYNRSVKNMEEIKYFIKEENKDNYRWYVCYGSNMLKRRFMCYLTGKGDDEYNVKATNDPCKNQSEPLCSLRVEVPYELYYGNSSSRWNNHGAAFLDPNKKGSTIGRAYLITKEQYEHVHIKEGKIWYGHEIVLGEIDGIKVVTFTNEERQMENAPSDAYKKVINAGTKETMELEYCKL
ncbi:MAG: gamma-glutamylcyclotransferase, partial [Clostridia bacterium]|nr:gamma-glutamylcyclotransferase [Clostridia bacterium]